MILHHFRYDPAHRGGTAGDGRADSIDNSFLDDIDDMLRQVLIPDLAHIGNDFSNRIRNTQ
jgi:hypothetical protein